MKVNFCPSCGKSVHGQVRFCSNCGADLSRLVSGGIPPTAKGDFTDALKGFIESFMDNNSELLKDLAARAEKGEHPEKGMFFAVEMRGDKPIIRSGDIKDFENLIKNMNFPQIKKIFSEGGESAFEFEEVKATVFDEEDGKIVMVELPGVSNLDDVSVNPVPDGLEVIGRGRDRIYFANVPLPGYVKVTDKNLEKGKLTVHLK